MEEEQYRKRRNFYISIFVRIWIQLAQTQRQRGKEYKKKTKKKLNGKWILDDLASETCADSSIKR